MRVFLTGASGYVAGVLIELLARMPEVECITGIASKQPTAPLPPKMKFMRMDIRSNDLTAAVAGHDALINTAAVVFWPAKMPVKERDEINLDAIRNVARAALANGVRRFIHTGSMAVYDPELARGETGVTEDFPLGRGDSRFYYWNGKAVAERRLTELLRSSPISLTSLRPIYIIGPRNKTTARRYRENALNIPGHDPRRQFIHEEDVAAAFKQALLTDMPGAYNVVPDDFIRMSDVWRIVGAKSVKTAPLWLARLVTSIRWRWFGSSIHPSWVEDMLVDFTGSNARLKSVGWRPRYGSAEALRSAV